MFLLIEINNDGCYEKFALVATSASYTELEELMYERWTYAYRQVFDWIDFDENDETYCYLEPGANYASIGCDGNGELIEWHIINTNDNWETC